MSSPQYEAIRNVFGPALTPFTSDHVANYVGVPDDGHEANAANNAVGAAFARASREGIIRPTGRTFRSAQPHRKGGMIREWIGAGAPVHVVHVGTDGDRFRARCTACGDVGPACESEGDARAIATRHEELQGFERPTT